MAKISVNLCHGATFHVVDLFPSFIQESSYNLEGIRYDAHVLLARNSSQLVFKIWDVKNESRIEINGQSTFFFDILPHSEFKENDDCIKGYEYRPRGEYGICDCEKYDGGSLEAIINCLIIDLIESSKKQ